MLLQYFIQEYFSTRLELATPSYIEEDPLLKYDNYENSRAVGFYR